MGALTVPAASLDTQVTRAITNYITHNNQDVMKGSPSGRLATVKTLQKHFAPNHEGRIEALYIDNDGNLMTAFLTSSRPLEVIYVAEGW